MDRYLKHIYPDKESKETTSQKGKSKGKKKINNSYKLKKVI